MLDLGGRHGVWAIEIKRGLVPKPERGFYHSLEDLQPSRAIVVYSGQQRYPISGSVEAVSPCDLAQA